MSDPSKSNEALTIQDTYKIVEHPPAGVKLNLCPVCGSTAELWQYTYPLHESNGGQTHKVVMCTNDGDISDDLDAVDTGCPLYMPPNRFYRPTMREAITEWNRYADAITDLRERNLKSHDEAVSKEGPPAQQPMMDQTLQPLKRAYSDATQ